MAKEDTEPFPFKPWLLRSGLGSRRPLKRPCLRTQLLFTPKLGAREFNSSSITLHADFCFIIMIHLPFFKFVVICFDWEEFEMGLLNFCFFLKVFVWGEIVVQKTRCAADGYWIGRNGYVALVLNDSKKESFCDCINGYKFSNNVCCSLKLYEFDDYCNLQMKIHIAFHHLHHLDKF